VDKSRVNPWSWQEKFGFSHAWRVDGARSVILLAGQGPVTADGQVLEGDFEAQVLSAALVRNGSAAFCGDGSARLGGDA
jgi:hypothetical protein